MEENKTTNEVPQTIKERVIYIIRQLNLSVAKFERLVGWSVGYVSTIKETFKLKKANQIKKVFKNVNINFIMKGKGEPFKAIKDDPRLVSEETFQGRFKKLLAQLHEKGLVRNQSDLAKQLGYNSTYLSVIANNRNRVPANFVEKLKTIDNTIDGDWLLNDPVKAEDNAAKDNQQTVLDAVNALPDTTEVPAEEPKKSTKQKKEAKGKPGRKPSKAKAEKAAEAEAPKAEKVAEAAPAEAKGKPGRKPGRKPAAKETKVAETPAPKAEKAPKAEPKQEDTNILHPIDELLLQNRLLITEIRKQGERVDAVLDILKAKI
ncbi:MAG: hypothetical protein J5826_00860 [Bacteroidales bacterium]|nr:hypothetical protein [Bacteroidales bacterium]